MAIVAMIGASGGLGKSTLAVHLACGAIAHGRSSLLLDYDHDWKPRVKIKEEADNEEYGPWKVRPQGK